MTTQTSGRASATGGRRYPRRISKKDQILSLYASGIGEVEDLAMITGSRPSYVASVLQRYGLISGYFDLYTTTSNPMNVYSKFFAGKLGFKDEETCRKSIALIDRLHAQFEIAGDRAGQHHALAMALTMFDRARWTGKAAEAEVFRKWLADKLDEAREELAEAPASETEQMDEHARDEAARAEAPIRAA